MNFDYFFRVFAAFLAARERDAADRFCAALRACRESARFEAALCPSRFNARELARERFADFLALFFFPFFRSRAACLRVFLDPFLGGFSLTPARLAFESPMAIACLVERAPCLPSRTCSISSRTNSPAWVLGAFPSFLSSSARSRVSFSGIDLLLRCDESTGSSGPAQSRMEIPANYPRIAEGWGRPRQVQCSSVLRSTDSR